MEWMLRDAYENPYSSFMIDIDVKTHLKAHNCGSTSFPARDTDCLRYSSHRRGPLEALSEKHSACCIKTRTHVSTVKRLTFRWHLSHKPFCLTSWTRSFLHIEQRQGHVSHTIHFLAALIDQQNDSNMSWTSFQPRLQGSTTQPAALDPARNIPAGSSNEFGRMRKIV